MNSRLKELKKEREKVCKEISKIQDQLMLSGSEEDRRRLNAAAERYKELTIEMVKLGG